MKPAWDKLSGEFADSKTVLVADVDCTAAGKDLCETQGVEVFPTIKYGDPDDLKKYEGGRSYEDLKAFAESSLGPQCGPGDNIGLCSDKVRAKIEKFLAMTSTDLEAKIKTAQDKVAIDVPLMNKAMAYVSKVEAGGGAAKDGKGEL